VIGERQLLTSHGKLGILVGHDATNAGALGPSHVDLERAGGDEVVG
jgi:hypothetical protein